MLFEAMFLLETFEALWALERFRTFTPYHVLCKSVTSQKTCLAFVALELLNTCVDPHVPKEVAFL